MKVIPLTQGQYALVDVIDFEKIIQHKWRAQRDKRSGKFYAVRSEPGDDGKRKTIGMHRQLLGLRPGDARLGDHWNGDTLDNRRENLRIATASQNQHNRRRQRTNTSGFKCIHWNKLEQKWIATIGVNGERWYLGARDTAEAAYTELYVPAALVCHGEFARVA